MPQEKTRTFDTYEQAFYFAQNLVCKDEQPLLTWVRSTNKYQVTWFPRDEKETKEA